MHLSFTSTTAATTSTSHAAATTNTTLHIHAKHAQESLVEYLRSTLLADQLEDVGDDDNLDDDDDDDEFCGNLLADILENWLQVGVVEVEVEVAHKLLPLETVDAPSAVDFWLDSDTALACRKNAKLEAQESLTQLILKTLPFHVRMHILDYHLVAVRYSGYRFRDLMGYFERDTTRTVQLLFRSLWVESVPSGAIHSGEFACIMRRVKHLYVVVHDTSPYFEWLVENASQHTMPLLDSFSVFDTHGRVCAMASNAHLTRHARMIRLLKQGEEDIQEHDLLTLVQACSSSLRVFFSGSPVPESVQHVIAHMPNMRRFGASYSSQRNLSYTIDNLDGIRSLAITWLGDDSITPEWFHLNPSASSGSLTWIGIAYARRHIPIKFHSLPNVRSLTRLDLINIEVGSLAGIRHMTNLNTLTLRIMEGTTAIEELAECRSLRDLCIDDFRFSNSSQRSILQESIHKLVQFGLHTLSLHDAERAGGLGEHFWLSILSGDRSQLRFLNVTDDTFSQKCLVLAITRDTIKEVHIDSILCVTVRRSTVDRVLMSQLLDDLIIAH